MEQLNDIIFYHLDKGIRTYRQFAQKQLKKAELDLTIDQWLVLKAINDNRNLSQKDIAATVLKDEASVTRIIELLLSSIAFTIAIEKMDAATVNELKALRKVKI